MTRQGVKIGLPLRGYFSAAVDTRTVSGHSAFRALFGDYVLCIVYSVPRRMFLNHIHATLGSLHPVATP
jgi:hypothetical protein